jgi:glyoxalase family protein
MDAGVGVTGPYDRGYFHSIYFADPDGQILEIATAGPGYAVDEPADTLGGELKMPPDSLLRGTRNEEAIAKLTHPEPVAAITADMALTGIHHVSAITDDLERAGEFYEASLGLSLVKKTVNRDDAKMLHYFWAAYDGRAVAPRSSLTLFGWEGSTLRARGGTGQTHHIAFRAADEEQQLAWREHLLELGVQVTPVLDRNYFQSIYFRAPDGLLCEIATDGPGFAVDEAPDELGRALQLPEWLERDRTTIEQQLAELPAAPIG